MLRTHKKIVKVQKAVILFVVSAINKKKKKMKITVLYLSFKYTI